MDRRGLGSFKLAKLPNVSLEVIGRHRVSQKRLHSDQINSSAAFQTLEKYPDDQSHLFRA